jgi:hypothetical protein
MIYLDDTRVIEESYVPCLASLLDFLIPAGFCSDVGHTRIFTSVIRDDVKGVEGVWRQTDRRAVRMSDSALRYWTRDPIA